MKQNQKRIIITGANGAMAKETIKHLLKDGFREIVMACRTESKGKLARKEILDSIVNPTGVNLSVVGGFDMNNPLAIEKAVSTLAGQKPFDIVFLAAGFAVFADDFQKVSWNGKEVEKNIFQNLIGSHISLSQLKKKRLLNPFCRVVIAGGEGARGIPGLIEKPQFESPKHLREYIYCELKNGEKYNPMNAIGVSKFAGALWVQKMSELTSNEMEVIWFSPGLTSGSAGLKKLPLFKRIAFGFMFGVMNLLGKSQTPEKGGRKYANCLEGKIGESGDILGAPEGAALGKITDQIPMNPDLSNEGLKNELWAIVQEVAGPFEKNVVKL